MGDLGLTPDGQQKSVFTANDGYTNPRDKPTLYRATWIAIEPRTEITREYSGLESIRDQS